jgi:hypothetical protein
LTSFTPYLPSQLGTMLRLGGILLIRPNHSTMSWLHGKEGLINCYAATGGWEVKYVN